jgi:hypothetical protein
MISGAASRVPARKEAALSLEREKSIWLAPSQFAASDSPAPPIGASLASLDWLAEDIAFDRTQTQHSLDEIIHAVQGGAGFDEGGDNGRVIGELG